MIGKLVRRMLSAQILSALTVSLCLLIDNIMIGRYLGDGALAAYGLSNPLLLLIGAVGSMLCAGAQVSCARSLGRGDQRDTNAGYSSSLAVAAVFSAVFVMIVLLARVPLGRLLGAKEETLLADTSGYIAGFVIGAPATMGALILVPFLQMAGQSTLLIFAVLGMTIADIGFDLLNVLVFHGGMFGMGLASSISYYVALLIGGSYFVSGKCVFRFSAGLVSMKKIRELIRGGVPTVFCMASSVVMIFAVNKILLGKGGEMGVAAFTVINTIINASNCISTGTGGVALTLSGILYNEEDRTGLKELIGCMLGYACVLGAAVAALLLVFARPCVTLFIPNAGESQTMAIYGLRIFAIGLIPCCVNNALKNCWLGMEKAVEMEVISVLEGAVFPIAAVLVLSGALGLKGAWFLFLTAESMTLLAMLCHIWRKKGKVTWKRDDILLLTDRFGVPAEDALEAGICNMEQVMAFSQAAEAFCIAHGGDRRLAAHLALCIEEMGGNIVDHGFAHSRGGNHLYIRIQKKENRWTMRFRDDCTAFDPVSHMMNADKVEKDVGIRLAMRIADEARYTYSMNLNNLTLVLKEDV